MIAQGCRAGRRIVGITGLEHDKECLINHACPQADGVVSPHFLKSENLV
jgi:hypothetical protein